MDSRVFGTFLLRNQDEASDVIQNVYSEVNINPHHMVFCDSLLVEPIETWIMEIKDHVAENYDKHYFKKTDEHQPSNLLFSILWSDPKHLVVINVSQSIPFFKFGASIESSVLLGHLLVDILLKQQSLNCHRI